MSSADTAGAGGGQDADRDRIVLGRWEWVSLPGLGCQAQRARVDTGARRSSLHATDIRVDGSRVTLTLACGGTGELPLVGHAHVRSSNGEVEERPVVELPLTVAGLTVLARCTLTDRSSMRFPVLLGRDLLAGRFLVDPALRNQHPHPRPPTGARR